MAKQPRPSAPVRRSPRAARPASQRGTRAPLQPGRPLLVPFAAVFGGLVVLELAYLTWLLVDPGAGFDEVPGWPVGVLVAMAVWVAVGAVLVLLGRARGWLVLALGSIPPLLGLLGIAVLFGSLGGGRATWWAVLMTVGPIGALVLACQRPVREWTRRRGTPG
ncbi:hypothetical protein [Modestobacter sp. Leaf380]|uniref:hypothetical protein n=1 Tax=Modestobacter sp. Leaf380 TaxID=1736356 RepID=UPI0012FB7BF1|nr:hypothetical protein [Modestobacter sp. Leaf380]